MEKTETPSIIHSYIREAIIVLPTVSTDAVYSTFRREDTSCVIVCEGDRMPVGLVMKERYYRHLGQRFGAQLYFGRSIEYLMERDFLTVELDTPVEEIIDIALNRTSEQFHDAVVLIENQQLVGFLTIQDILQLSRQLQMKAVMTQVESVMLAQEMLHKVNLAVSSILPATQAGIQSTTWMSQLTTEGRTYLQDVFETLQKVSSMTNQQQMQMVELEDRAAAVTDILQVIHQLSDQSYLLALNANIEAARSGEKGFHVIAQEVGQLAKQTKQHADQVETLLLQMNESIQRTVELTASSKRVTDNNSDRVKETNRIFDELFLSINQNIAGMNQIDAAVGIAASETHRVSNSMDDLLETIQQG